MSELKETLPPYMITKAKVELGNLNADMVLNRIGDRFSSAGELTRIDGLKIDFPDSWVHLRKSNTEPIIRIIAEAPNQPEAERLAKQFTREILGL